MALDQWVMYGGGQAADGRPLVVALHPRTVQMHGFEPFPVQVILDPEGSYYGWLGPGDEAPRMMQPHLTSYRIQFAYGPEAEEARGRGATVRLRVEAT